MVSSFKYCGPKSSVIYGNSGLNCHLSQLISYIIDPVAYGNEIDSSDDMISKIKGMNDKIKSFNESKSFEENMNDEICPPEFEACVDQPDASDLSSIVGDASPVVHQLSRVGKTSLSNVG